MRLGQAASVARSASDWPYAICSLNLLGDPEMPLWTANPGLLAVSSSPGLILGTQSVTVLVRDARQPSSTPIREAQVCLYTPGEIFATSLTDTNGAATLAVTCDTMNEVMLTLTAPNYRPYLDSLPVGPTVNPHLYVANFRTDDDGEGASHGNGDNQANPGEILELPLKIANSGGRVAQNVQLTLTSLSSNVTVIAGGPVAVGDIAPGQPGTIAGSNLVVQVAWPGPWEQSGQRTRFVSRSGSI